MNNLNPEVEKYLQSMEDELEYERGRSMQLAKSQSALFNAEQDDNLIKYQLQFTEELTQIYHLLRGHQIKEDEDGNLIYVEPTSIRQIPFSEEGVQQIMQSIVSYINKNTILSNYEDEVINWKILDFGNTLADEIHNTYETIFYAPTDEELSELAMEELKKERELIKKITKDVANITLTEIDLQKIEFAKITYKVVKDKMEQIKREMMLDRMKRYPMIIRQITDMIHSSYLRAFHGGERSSLKTARVVTQNEPIAQQYMNSPQASVKTKWWNPKTWGK